MSVTIEDGWAVVVKNSHTYGDGQILLTSGEMSRIAHDYGGRCDDLAMPPPPEDGMWVWEGEIVDGLPANRDFLFQGGYRRATPEDLGAFWFEWWQEHKESERLRARMGDLLTQTANALKGDPPPLTLHDWSDLPEVAARMAEVARMKR